MSPRSKTSILAPFAVLAICLCVTSCRSKHGQVIDLYEDADKLERMSIRYTKQEEFNKQLRLVIAKREQLKRSKEFTPDELYHFMKAVSYWQSANDKWTPTFAVGVDFEMNRAALEYHEFKRVQSKRTVGG